MKNAFRRAGLVVAIAAALTAAHAFAADTNTDSGGAAPTGNGGAAEQAAAGKSAGAKSADQPAVMQDIMVTAEKRAERLQEVPISETVLGAEQMQRARIDSGTEVARQTPNLRVSVLGDESQPKFSMRGLSTPDFNLNSISPTGVFYDEVYIGAQYLGGAQIYDLARVEVLRGPQGTLFGKNTTAGAINFISAPPSFENEAYVTAGFGSYAFRELKGAVEVPLVPDRFSVRVAFNTAHSDGYIKNVSPGQPDLSNIDRRAVRVSLGYKGEDESDLRATLRLFHNDSNPRSIGVVNTGNGPDGLNALGIDPRINPYTGKPLGPREVARENPGHINEGGNGGSLTIEKDLGFATLTSITSHLTGHFSNQVDADGTPSDLLHIWFRQHTKETSQDLRLTTNGDGPFKVIGGLYYFSDDMDVPTTYDVFRCCGGPELAQHYDQKRTSYAAYVDGTYKFGADYTAYAGLRYTDDKGVMSNFEVTPVIPLQPDLKYHDGEPTGRIGLRKEFSSDLMVYAQYARGYRSSAFNGGALTNLPNVAAPEKLNAYEVGLKSQWLDRRVTFNASAFLYNFANQQFTNLVGVADQQLVNAGSSRVKGVELELAAHPNDALRLSAGLGLLDGSYRSLVLNGVNLSGNDMIEAPHSTLNLSADYSVPLALGNLTLHADATHVGSQYFLATNVPASHIGAFWDVGARIVLVSKSGRFEWAVYGKNLTDNKVVTGLVIDATSATNFRVLPYPRRYGAEMTVWF